MAPIPFNLSETKTPGGAQSTGGHSIWMQHRCKLCQPIFYTLTIT
jgi:hypothetical protein